jgi:hypothetical protein
MIYKSENADNVVINMEFSHYKGRHDRKFYDVELVWNGITIFKESEYSTPNFWDEEEALTGLLGFFTTQSEPGLPYQEEWYNSSDCDMLGIELYDRENPEE